MMELVHALFVQEGENKTEHPISYYSKKYNKYQRNYAIVEKEALALLLISFKVFWYQSSSLIIIRRMKHDDQLLLKWSLTLQEYNLVINHIKDKNDVVACYELKMPSCNKVKNEWKVPKITGLNRVAIETMETAEVEQWIKIRVFWSTNQVMAITIYNVCADLY